MAEAQLEWGTGTSDVKLGLQELEDFKYLVSADDGNMGSGGKVWEGEFLWFRPGVERLNLTRYNGYMKAL